MTISIVVPSAKFQNTNKYLWMPHFEKAKGFFLFGGDIAESVKNRAPYAPVNGSVVGSPTFSNGFASFNASNGVKAGYTNGKPYTYIIIARHQEPNTQEGLIGHWLVDGNTAATADLLFIQLGSLYQAVDGTSRGAIVNNIPTTGFCFYAATYDGLMSKSYAHDGNSLLSDSGAYSSTSGDPSVETRIGASGYGNGDWDCAASVMFQDALTTEQLTSIYTYLKILLSTRGISVV